MRACVFVCVFVYVWCLCVYASVYLQPASPDVDAAIHGSNLNADEGLVTRDDTEDEEGAVVKDELTKDEQGAMASEASAAVAAIAGVNLMGDGMDDLD